MSLDTTTLIFALAAAAALISVIGMRRPRALGRIWFPPYNLILFLAILVMLLMAAHMISLITGKPFAGRLGN